MITDSPEEPMSDPAIAGQISPALVSAVKEAVFGHLLV